MHEINQNIPVSVAILTKNSRKYLHQVLSALALFDEVLLCDTGSDDDTLAIAGAYPNVHIRRCPFIGFGPTRNQASLWAKHDWILWIDSDEVASAGLPVEVAREPLQRGRVYSFPRRNQYRGKWIRWCGWHPDRCIRLYNRLDTRFTADQVHEAVDASGLQEIALCSPLWHYSYADVADFLSKMQTYSTLFALQYQGKKRASLATAIGHGAYAFFKSYLLKRGFLGGREGLEISVYQANTAFYKYLKLAEANRRQLLQDAPMSGGER